MSPTTFCPWRTAPSSTPAGPSTSPSPCQLAPSRPSTTVARVGGWVDQLPMASSGALAGEVAGAQDAAAQPTAFTTSPLAHNSLAPLPRPPPLPCAGAKACVAPCAQLCGCHRLCLNSRQPPPFATLLHRRRGVCRPRIQRAQLCGCHCLCRRPPLHQPAGGPRSNAGGIRVSLV